MKRETHVLIKEPPPMLSLAVPIEVVRIELTEAVLGKPWIAKNGSGFEKRDGREDWLQELIRANPGRILQLIEGGRVVSTVFPA